jgi:Cu/Ag efflux protein CusF
LQNRRYQRKKTEEALEMKKEIRIALTLLASSALVAAVWALSPASGSARAANTSTTGQTQPAQSVSGKIASIEKSSFTLTVGPEHSAVTPDRLQSQNSAKTMTFQVDQNTTIDGKLKVGANADVTYRQEGGNNIAISVRVGS